MDVTDIPYRLKHDPGSSYIEIVVDKTHVLMCFCRSHFFMLSENPETCNFDPLNCEPSERFHTFKIDKGDLARRGMKEPYNSMCGIIEWLKCYVIYSDNQCFMTDLHRVSMVLYSLVSKLYSNERVAVF